MFFSTLVNAFKDAEIRKKLLFTLFILFIYILGTWVPVPGINIEYLQGEIGSDTSLISILNSVNGGALTNGAILALGVTPYIFASIVVQLLAGVIPSWERLRKEGGEEGQRKMNLYTRIGALILAIAQSVGLCIMFTSSESTIIDNIMFDNQFLTCLFLVIMFVSGAMFTVWLGEQITSRGVGNGLSLMVFIGILSSTSIALLETIKDAFSSTDNLDNLWTLLIFLVAVIVVFTLIVYIDLARRKIPVTYAKQIRGRKMMGGQSTDLELKVNAGGVMPIIFASTLVAFPQILIQIFDPNLTGGFSQWYTVNLGMGSWIYTVFMCVFILLFAFFYASMQFQPDEVARRIQENGGMVAKNRPGKPTVEYLKKINNRITLFGAIFLAFVAFVPAVVFKAIDQGSLVSSFTATGMLIIVSVALEFNRQLEEQMIVRNYRGFLK